MGTALDQARQGRLFDLWLQEEMKTPAPCQWEDCKLPAAYRFRMPCCGSSRNLCGPHRILWMRIARSFKYPKCTDCGADPIIIDDVVWLEI